MRIILFLFCVFNFHTYLCSAEWCEIDTLMNAAVLTRLIPGGVVCVTDADSVIFLKAYGNRSVYPDTLPMTDSTIFDIASLSKPAGTAMAALKLAEENKIALDDYVCKYIDEFEGDATIAQLLNHTSGLPSYVNVTKLKKAYGVLNDTVLLDYVCHCPRIFKEGERAYYSCLNYIMLQHVIERASGEKFSDYCLKHVFLPLGMYSTRLLPDTTHLENIAPTELGKDNVLLWGVVHDPLARMLNHGNSGNAGVFSNAHDLALLAQLLLQNKSSDWVQLLTTEPDDAEPFGRTMGWEINSDDITFTGTMLSNCAYCHTGYTGTSMVVDPENNVAVIILTNRVHPKDKGNINKLRGLITDAVAQILAITDKNFK